MSDPQISLFYEILGWMPAWSATILLVAMGAIFAIVAHAIAIRVFTTLFSQRAIYVQTLVRRTRLLTCAIAVFIAASLAIQMAPLSDESLSVISSILGACLIVIIGWSVLVATHIAADIYMARFELDVADNLLARKHVTQLRILRRVADTLVVLLTLGAGLMSFESVRQYGISVFASAGAAGLVLGFAARPVLENLIAGIQIAITQPIRIDDAVVVEGEWGWIEEINGTYVVIRIWDWRRLIVPLSYFIQNPFTNWTRESASIIGTVYLYTDYNLPVDELREHLNEVAKSSPLWDGKVVNLQVTDAGDRSIEIRALVSAATSPQAWDLRCYVREKLVSYLRERHPDSLPQVRSRYLDEENLNGKRRVDGVVADEA
ncbi:MscS Mechanosensitive ion channel [Parvibaculum lavamentivorans DS-1]|uniref:MscS Mechanosensitive ion channel n=1 Tax=Parvibaculum lavamentivorans (strain DS-1 / DSM 13023 / NCIMB 13966) TaxID=402881 RepID=A7HX29_PARL1|nr:mechanosensitive ion channel domain-containing protein [Parvibaculum lavamentivorans]ABS64462.1 MscS Mechanosensitive ion channel [Parvibaculum lavamentivorans DS-1]